MTRQKLKAKKSPVVADWEGRLYNKIGVLEYLLSQKSGKTNSTTSTNITSINDVVQLKINLDTDAETLLDPLTSTIHKLDSCPTMCYLVPCGCVMDKAALLQLIKQEKQVKCLVCSTEFEKRDIVTINPSTIVLQELQSRYDKLKAESLWPNLKPRKVKKKRGASADTTVSKKVKK